MEKLELLKEKRIMLTSKLDNLDQETIKTYLSLTNELNEIDKCILDATITEQTESEKECKEQDGHIWAVLRNEFIPDHKSYNELTCECIVCGAHEINKSNYFKSIINLKVPNYEDLLMGAYVRTYLGNFYIDLINEKHMSKKDALNYIQNNINTINKQFEIYYSTKSNSKVRIKI